jgi:hypothetical protein
LPRGEKIADLLDEHLAPGRWRRCRFFTHAQTRQHLDHPEDAKLTIRNWITALRKTPIFRVTARAFCASASVGADAPFSVMKTLVESMPPTRRPMIGVKMSLTRLFYDARERDADDDADSEVNDIAAHDERAEFFDPGRAPTPDQ